MGADFTHRAPVGLEEVGVKIEVTGRGEEVSAAMKQKASEKIAKVFRFFDRITWVEVTLDSQKDRGSVDVTVGLPAGVTLVGKAESADVYSAIDMAVDKIVKQLRRHKERLKDRRTRRPGPSARDGGTSV
jgi:putative sigma-54 modulation protein